MVIGEWFQRMGSLVNCAGDPFFDKLSCGLREYGRWRHDGEVNR